MKRSKEEWINYYELHSNPTGSDYDSFGCVLPIVMLFIAVFLIYVSEVL